MSIYKTPNEFITPPFKIVGTKTTTSLRYAYEVCASILLDDKQYLNTGKFVEPFCGSASVTFALQPKKVVLADLQEHAVNTLRVLSKEPAFFLSKFNELRDAFFKEPTKKHYNAIRASVPVDSIDKAVWYMFLIHACYNWLWRVNKKGRNNTPMGDEFAMKRLDRAFREDELITIYNYFQNNDVTFKHQDAMTTIAESDSSLIYCDPPYPDKFDNYCATPFGHKGHDELAVALKDAYENRRCQVVLHCSLDKELAKKYGGWCHLYYHPKKTRVNPNNLQKWCEMIIVSKHDASIGGISSGPHRMQSYFSTPVQRAEWNQREGTWQNFTLE